MTLTFFPSLLTLLSGEWQNLAIESVRKTIFIKSRVVVWWKEREKFSNKIYMLFFICLLLMLMLVCENPQTNIYSVFHFQYLLLLLLRQKRTKKKVSDQQKIILVWKFVTYFHIFHWHAKQVVILFLSRLCMWECEQRRERGKNSNILGWNLILKFILRHIFLLFSIFLAFLMLTCHEIERERHIRFFYLFSPLILFAHNKYRNNFIRER